MHKRPENWVKKKLESGSPVLGTWCVIPSVVSVDVIASCDIDFLVIDGEHGPITFDIAQQMVMASESRGVSPLMRVGGVLGAEILRALDIGVHGVHIPNICSQEELKKAVLHCKYPPQGDRGFSPFTRASGYSHERSFELTKWANEEKLLCIHIEGREGIEKIDALLSIQEVDVVFIGLYDLSKCLGIPGEVEHRSVLDYAEQLAGKTLKAGKFPGTIVTKEKQVSRFVSMGMKYITFSVDCEMLLSSYQRASSAFKTMVCDF